MAFSGCLSSWPRLEPSCNLLWRCYRYCNKNSQPAPVFMCFIFLTPWMPLIWKMCLVIKKQSCTIKCLTVTFHQHIFLSRYWNAFLCVPCVLFSDFWFLCNTTVAWSSNYLEQKSQQFFQKTVSVIIWHLNYCFHKNGAALSVARIGLKHTHSVKTAKQIPLTETLRARQRMCCSPLCDWTGSVLLFHRTPQKMVFPWVVVCNQVHVFSWPLISAVSGAEEINRAASGGS